jgi:putative endonuclease
MAAKAMEKAEERTPADNMSLKELAVSMACAYLENSGIEVIERQWRCGADSIGIVAREDDELAFIEVLGKKGMSGDLPSEGVMTDERRTRAERLAIGWLALHDTPSCRVRFDIISIAVAEKNRAFVKHHRDAYSAA